MSKMDIYLIDNLNNLQEEVNMIKPKTYQELLKQIKQSFRDIPGDYEIFILDKNNKEIKIDNEDNYRKIENFLFIREINKDFLEKSLFDINFDKLSESKQDILEEKYKCLFCSIIIKIENPYFCYQCQNMFHEKCLKDWDNKCKLQNKN